MEDKPTADAKQPEGTQGATEPPPPPLAQAKSEEVRRENQKIGTEKPAAHPGPPESHLRRFWKWIYPMEFSDFVMIGLTFFIACGTIVSAFAIYWQYTEMVNGGADTTAIKVAAQKQADAAQKFADTAILINGNVNGAVSKLDEQAKTIDAARKDADAASKATLAQSEKALNATISTARASQQAFIVVPLQSVISVTCVPSRMASRTPPDMCISISLINIGNTAAVGLNIKCKMRASTTDYLPRLTFVPPIPDSDLGPCGQGTGSDVRVGETKSFRAQTTSVTFGSPNSWYLRGAIGYWNIFGGQHSYGFCIFHSAGSGAVYSCGSNYKDTIQGQK